MILRVTTLSLAMIALQVLIWRYDKNELQDWCSRCAFGRLKNHRYGSAKLQVAEFLSLTKEKS